MAKKKPLTKEEKRLETLAIETEKKKRELVSQLRKTPIVQLACERSGVGRSTYYQWRASDKIFARVAERAIDAGRFFINDLAESKLISMIQGGNLTATIFWLKYNHPQYSNINRIINEYEIVTDRPSVEERNSAIQAISKILAKRHSLQLTKEEIKENVEEELLEAEKDEELYKKLKSYENDSGGA